jgi:hypothetical protein
MSEVFTRHQVFDSVELNKNSLFAAFGESQMDRTQVPDLIKLESVKPLAVQPDMDFGSMSHSFSNSGDDPNAVNAESNKFRGSDRKY